MSKQLWRAIGEKRYRYAIQELTEGIIDANAKYAHGWSCLHASCERGYPEITQILIKMGADVNLADWSGDTPLHMACNRPNIEDIQMLFNAKARQLSNKQGRMPSHNAASKGYSEVIKVLVAQNKIVVNIQDKSGRTALHEAASHGFIKAVITLVQCGADPNLVTSSTNMTAYDLAIEAEHMDVAKYLANLTTPTTQSKTTSDSATFNNTSPVPPKRKHKDPSQQDNPILTAGIVKASPLSKAPESVEKFNADGQIIVNKLTDNDNRVNHASTDEKQPPRQPTKKRQAPQPQQLTLVTESENL